MTEHVVIVGAGQAGASLSAKLRALEFDGPVTLIGAEPSPPYQRPPLSKKYLLGEMSAERLLLKPASFYAENDIDLILDAHVVQIDRKSKRLQLRDGREIGYDKLALTTGSTPRRLAEEMVGSLEGIFTIRGIADIDLLAPRLIAEARALIVGGGYIGLEAAAIASTIGLNVTVIEAAPRILNRVAAPETAEYFRSLHRDHGVQIRESCGLTSLTGLDGSVASATLSDGTEMQVDVVIAGIGIEPNTALAAASGLTVDGGIVVDAETRTSDPDIFAAGDCAVFPYSGSMTRLESVQNAIDQAEHTASVICGNAESYQPEPWFWSDQYDCKLQIAGLNRGYSKTVVRPGSRAGGQSVWYFDDGRLLAVDAMNDPRAYMQGKRWLAAGYSPDPEKISQATIDFKDS